MKSTKITDAVLLASALTISHAAFAQKSTETPDDSSGIEEIVVIGSKTNALRQELSTSVGYFGGDRIEKEPISNIEDIFDRTANAYTGTTSFGAYSIRGVNNNGIVGAINNSNALASIVVNQVAMGVSSGDYIKPSLFDAQSVEILRGPQSAIQGPNSLIGSVYVNYNRPEFGHYDGKARVQAGELGTLDAALMQNVGLVDGVLAARVAYESRNAEGAAINTTTGSDDVHRIEGDTLRLMVRLQPLANDDLIFDLTYTNVDSDSNPFGLVLPTPTGGLFDRQQPYDVDDEYPADFNQLSLEAALQINDSLSLTAVTGSSAFDVVQRFDGDLTQFPLLAVDGIIEEELFSQEIRLNYQGDKIDALVGVFYSDGDYTKGFNGSGVFPDGNGGVRPFNTRTRNVETIEQTALFGKVNWQLSTQFEASLGLRFNREKRSTNNFADNNGLVSDLSAEESFDQVIPSIALTYQLTDQTSVGVSYAKGFQAGGIAFAVFVGQSAAYDEEFTNNYEFFLRHQSADRRLVLNANLFYVDWSDQQVAATVPGGFPGFDDLVVNAGESSIRGLETELEWRVSDQFNTYVSVGLIDTEFEDFVLNGVNLAGSSFPQSPDFNIAVGFDYQADNSWFTTGSLSFVDSAFTEISAPEFTELSPRTLLSARAGYQADSWKAYLWGTNLLDDEYELALFDARTFNLNAAYGRVAQPRVIGMGIEINW